MFGMLAVLVYLLAMGIPIFLLYRFHSQTWYWHSLSVLAAIALGFIPIPFELQQPEFDLLFGFTFIVLMIWGAGGLLLFRPQHHTPTTKNTHNASRKLAFQAGRPLARPHSWGHASSVSPRLRVTSTFIFFHPM